MPDLSPRISVCIPVFNFAVAPLLSALHQEMVSFQANDIEVLVWEDGSTDEDLKIENQMVCRKYASIIYFNSAINNGRSKVRNLLGQKARGEYLLFLDCDVRPVEQNFLKIYLQYSQVNRVICGGVINPPQTEVKGNALRLKYGEKRESRPVETRKRYPWRSFSTANFLVERNFFLENPFDETLKQYGHEDTLWGFNLRFKGVPVVHIQNPVEHHGIDPTSVFLEKTRYSVVNLVKVWESLGRNETFAMENSLLETGVRLQRAGLKSLARLMLGVTLPVMEKNLNSNHPSLFIFDLYKLYYLVQHL